MKWLNEKYEKLISELINKLNLDSSISPESLYDLKPEDVVELLVFNIENKYSKSESKDEKYLKKVPNERTIDNLKKEIEFLTHQNQDYECKIKELEHQLEIFKITEEKLNIIIASMAKGILFKIKDKNDKYNIYHDINIAMLNFNMEDTLFISKDNGMSWSEINNNFIMELLK